ncbi:hypothetical protein GCM10007860_22360 [Chitiniphilus shinanonensis]|uniref:Molecular chaperone n=1 Tax=Chitiniphilus shinanonensis TaxID=553088 RepID=A0ABQ6BUS4_9NEIS|nr:hypothetical protein [Chitiniphilus shinanonensis]GLS05086.1 hypothetical protein GCM10007860_22360 [Chitiniphilus shinanonensis]
MDSENLPSYRGAASPPFTDARSAKSWMQLLPLINAPVAHNELTEALTLLNNSGITPYESLKILELFREGIHMVQTALTERFLGRAVPFGQDEQNAWQQVVGMWALLRDAYARCWHAALDGQADAVDHHALAAERTLRYQCLVMREHLLAYKPVPPEQWQALYGYYTLADKAGVAEKPAKDSMLKVAGVAAPENVFVHTLLLAGASPYHFTARQILWLDERLPAFAQRAPLEREARALPGRGSLQIDFASPSAPRRIEPRLSGDTVREIDTYQLAQALSRRIKLLRNGENPEKLGLGEQFPSSAVESLLTDLYRTWCEQPTERIHPRADGNRTIDVIFGLSRQHLAVGKGSFALPTDGPQELAGDDLVRMQLFGRTQTLQTATASAELAPHETWWLRNESPQGMQLSRKATPGHRVALQQLLAVSIANRYYVGTVRWLQQEGDQIVIGVRLLPGQPHSAAVRPVDLVHAGRRGWTEGLALPATPTLRSPASLILPVGWFRPGRLVEWWDGESTRKLRLESALERGVDYERVHYVLAGQTR